MLYSRPCQDLNTIWWPGYIFARCVGRSSNASETPTLLHSNTNMIEAPLYHRSVIKVYLSSSQDRPTFSSLQLRLSEALVEINLRSDTATTFPRLFWTCSKISPDLFNAHDLIRPNVSYVLIRLSYDQLNDNHSLWSLSYDLAKLKDRDKSVNRWNGGIIIITFCTRYYSHCYDDRTRAL